MANNPQFAVFSTGFLALCGSIAWWSVPVAGVVGGLILMFVAAYPYLATSATRND